MYLIRYAEIGLKGKNRGYFERKLANNIIDMLRPYPHAKVERIDGRIVVHADNNDPDIRAALGRVFGISSFHPVEVVEKDLDTVKQTVVELLKRLAKPEGITTFKINARRADKTFPMTSPEINVAIGDYVYDTLKNYKVDVHDPEVSITVEMREMAYVYGESIPGLGGLPLGTSGKAVLMLSGGIDSPVAGYMAMKRGLNIYPVYFHTPPFTGELAKEKVVNLTKALSQYSPHLRLTCVYFTNVQHAIMENCKEEYGTVIMRRMMMRIAQKIAEQNDAMALITGESLGQVASQTLHAIAATNAVCHMPVLQPLIGFDKKDIIEIAEEIGTFDISVLPYEDCCAMFVPAKPKTRPKIDECEKTEAGVDWEPLFDEAIEKSEIIDVHAFAIHK